jgi:hypothetical protein
MPFDYIDLMDNKGAGRVVEFERELLICNVFSIFGKKRENKKVKEGTRES